ncbi:C2 and GRAM domain-containing protein At5g50170 isoform X2 [Olea europaea var. sylvestris]|uniref:C2 and GRAM domain-containing protein At5g50170 isoform X2 n=1 Tax=Olea europaea var. sylvestris TaxID=158386 RepID=UPI000C1D4CF7|nr:C2 and GRAM domain-containing protein At5g50170 isoform X2 [Olea europaea var. sylvestris]
MRLYVYLLEGRDWAVKDSYLKLQVGKFKTKTRVLKNTKNPFWNEEFVFRVHDLEDELVVSMYHDGEHQSGFFNGSAGDLVGRIKIPLLTVANEENKNLQPTWFSLERPKSVKSVDKDCGKLLLSLSLHGKGQDIATDHLSNVHLTAKNNNFKECERTFASSHNNHRSTAPLRKIVDGKQLIMAMAGRLEKIFTKKEETSKKDDSSEQSTALSDYEDQMEEPPNCSSFKESIELMQSKNEEREMPENLQGGILLDHMYMTLPNDLNMALFAPDSEFRNELVDLQGTTDIQEGPWTWKSGDTSCLTRVVTYTKAATKLVKSVKASEEQIYVKANGKEFAVLVNVSTPDVPYGNTFKIKLLYKIMPGAELSYGEESAHLVVSWAINFNQSTMMKGMIEGGARQGLKENFEQFSSLLSQKYEVITAGDMSDKDHILATLQTEQQFDWGLAINYFWNFTMVSTLFIFLYVLVHLFLCGRSKLQGLEFPGLDLPDSIGEIVTCGLLVFQLQKVYNMISRFVEASLRRGSDHGVKAQGDGWVLTVALIEGVNLNSLNPTELVDPYVVLTCNEILEFDAVEEPPSTLDVEVFDFDGPFDQSSSLGHAEINFLKHTSTELADFWVPLEGKIAQSSQSKLHVRIFLDNNNGVETIRDYLAKMEKEVGKKLNIRSPHRNSTFQKIFGLPPEEFLISDFSCSLKRKMPLQGRLFLSARIVGFYANLFGHKTKLFFLWEDIEDIHVHPPSLSTVGSPSLVIILHKGRGLDAKHGAKILDEEGRLHFHFHSFVSFNVASRTIMALWRTRMLEPDQKVHIAEQQLDDEGKPVLHEDTGSYLVLDDVNMLHVCSVVLPISIKSLMRIFDGGELEHKVMSKSGCLNYVTTAWESVASDVYERRISYRFSRRISTFGGEVSCTQQKSPIPNDGGWVVHEIMALHDVPFADHFRVQFRYQIEKSTLALNSCKNDIYVGVTWLKNTKFEPRVTRNIIGKFTRRLEEILQLVEKEILLATQL